LQQSLDIQKAIGDKPGEGTTLNNISQVYQAQGDYDTALDYLQQSLAILKAIGDKQGEGTTLNNISQVYKAQGDYETALDYLQQSLAIRKAIGDWPGMCATLFNIGRIQLQHEQTQAAIGTFVSAYQLAKRINHFQVLEALTGLAKQLGGEGLSMWEGLLQQSLASEEHTE